MYRNWYLEPGADELRFRTGLGVEKVIAYADIVEYGTVEQNGQQRFRVRSATGARLAVNPRMYALDPLYAAIAFRERTGRWPLRGEPR